MPATFRQIIQGVQTFQRGHLQINSFRFGDITKNLNLSNIAYPALFADIQAATIDKGQRQTFFPVQFWFVDRVNVVENEVENEVEIISDLSQMAGDLIAFLSDWELQEMFLIGDTSQVEFLYNEAADKTISTKITVNISVDYVPSLCAVPSTENAFSYMQTVDLYKAKIRGDDFISFLPGKKILIFHLGQELLLQVVKESDESVPEMGEFFYDLETGLIELPDNIGSEENPVSYQIVNTKV